MAKIEDYYSDEDEAIQPVASKSAKRPKPQPRSAPNRTQRTETRSLCGIIFWLLLPVSLAVGVYALRSLDIDFFGAQEAQQRSGVGPHNPLKIKEDVSKRNRIVSAFKDAWSAYERDAFGCDEYHPVSQRGSNLTDAGGVGYMIVDAIDTMMLMGLDEEYAKARNYIEYDLSFDKDGNYSTFETTIRVLGGLLSAYDLSPKMSPSAAHDPVFLVRAVELAERLMPAFKSPTGIPYSSVNFAKGEGIPDRDANGWASTAEVATLQLEFRYLSHVTDDPVYWKAAEKVMKVLKSALRSPLAPVFIKLVYASPIWAVMNLPNSSESPKTGQFVASDIRLGSRGDSFYEYLLKQYLQTDRSELVYRSLYDDAMAAVHEHLRRETPQNKLVYVAELQPDLRSVTRDSRPEEIGWRLEPKQDHLVCFLGGSLMLGATDGGTNLDQTKFTEAEKRDWKFGEDLIKTCMETHKTSTGLAPEIAMFRTGNEPEWVAQHAPGDWYIKGLRDAKPPLDVRYILRPETIESLFIAYRLTGDLKYREWGWQIFEAIEKHCKVPTGGYSGVTNVDAVPVEWEDRMETFMLSETLKYLFLLFSGGDVLPLNIKRKSIYPMEVFDQPPPPPTSAPDPPPTAPTREDSDSMECDDTDYNSLYASAEEGEEMESVERTLLETRSSHSGFDDELGDIMAEMSGDQIAALEIPGVAPDQSADMSWRNPADEASLSSTDSDPAESPLSRPLPLVDTNGPSDSSFTSSSSGGDSSFTSEPRLITPLIRAIPQWGTNATPGTQAPVRQTDTPRYSSNNMESFNPKRHIKIAHSAKHVRWFDNYSVPWGVQYQIATLISSGKLKWDDINESHIARFQRATNVDAAPTVRSVFFPNARKSTQTVPPNRNPWIELDKEAASLMAADGRMLGLAERKSEEEDERMGDWFGGRVEQRVSLVFRDPPRSTVNSSNKKFPKVDLVLRPHEVRGKSFRFARQFGSRRFLQMKLPDVTKDAERRAYLGDLLVKGFVILGRMYRVFSCHEGTARLIETSEDVERWTIYSIGDDSRLSLLEFLNWFNPFNPASSQPANQHVMTDGCGLINRAALKVIQEQRDLSDVPTAVQGRIAGAKGLWILHPSDKSTVPMIWVTESQVKINYSSEDLKDPSRRIFDLLRVGDVKSPIRLSNQPIINFWHNGVPTSTFQELLQEALHEDIDSLLEAWNEKDPKCLWKMVFARNRLRTSRRQQEEATYLRELGQFSDHEDEQSSEDLVDEEDVFNPSLLDFPDPSSMWPYDVAEQVVQLLQADFLPSNCQPLATGLKLLLKQEVQKMVKGPCHIPVKFSMEAFAAPDFLKVLKPGEVFFRASRSQLCGFSDEKSIIDGVLRGPVVIYRYPTRTPSDAQLVTAVDYPELYMLTDILVFSTQGSRSGANILGGGDYDGDVINMVVDPRVITKFHNASLKFADPPPDFMEWLGLYSQSSKEFHEEVAGLNEDKTCKELQRILVEPVTRESLVGRYSSLSEKAIYHLGYDHDETHYLNTMFANQLDAQKSGLHVLPGVYEEDEEHYGKLPAPACLSKYPNASDSKDGQKDFVLDLLNPFAEDQLAHYTRLIDALSTTREPDASLLQPLQDAEGRIKRLSGAEASEMRKEIDGLKQFVAENKKEWGGTFTGASPNSPGRRLSLATLSCPSRPTPRRGSSRASVPNPDDPFFSYPRKMQIICKREIARNFRYDFDFETLKYFDEEGALRLMAAYAYDLACRRGGSLEYAFVVAFHQLSNLKAKASKQSCHTIIGSFHNALVPPKGPRNALRRQGSSAV
ncbi:mannosyl-oligosaccharide alpha-1,2-mannosidase [Tulasnella sp. 403]|nr:mannosyl-oligosaccharide alpha-1,2-mannosidase [Tulasnella sp. 403]